MVAIAGDLADGFVADLKDAASPLCNLRPKYGVYFATGQYTFFDIYYCVWLITMIHGYTQLVICYI